MKGKYKSLIRVDNIDYFSELTPESLERSILDGEILRVFEFYGTDSRVVYINTSQCKVIRVEAH